MKRFVRAHTDQTFNMMMKLIPHARYEFAQELIQMKLLRRFWDTLAEYHEGTTYVDVLKLYFCNLCKPKMILYRHITNSKFAKRFFLITHSLKDC
jgi:hypothetical protein